MVGRPLGLLPCVYWSCSSNVYGLSLNCSSMRRAPFFSGNTLCAPTYFWLNSFSDCFISFGTLLPTFTARIGYPGRVLCMQYHSTLQYPFFFVCANWTDERDWIIIEGRSSPRWEAEDVSYPPMRRWPRKNGGQGISRSFFGESTFFCPLSVCFFVFGLTFLALVG